MRRLPIYFVIDVSESMIGEPLKRMEEGIEQIVSTLRQDPNALETVYISVIAFAGKAKVIAPLVDLMSFYPPKVPIGGGTALGEALHTLMDEIDHKIKKSTPEERGDWKPIVFLITDGKPTDSPNNAISKWKESYSNQATLIAITLGTNADIQKLGQLTDTVLALESSTQEDFKKFIDWISASVSMQSQKLDMSSDIVSLDKLEDGHLTLIKEPESFISSDPDFVVLNGRCSKTKKPYLMKYTKTQVAGMERFIVSQLFMLEGAFALDDSYYELSSDNTLNEQVNTSNLEGVPPCPHCGGFSAFAMCKCNNLLCIDHTGQATCPWCSTHLQFDMGHQGGDFNVTRGQG